MNADPRPTLTHRAIGNGCGVALLCAALGGALTESAAGPDWRSVFVAAAVGFVVGAAGTR